VRHLGSIVLSLILAPVIYLLAGIGVVEAVENGSVAEHPDYVKVTIGILAIGAAGLLYCLLALTRISPVGPVLAALLYFAVSVWALFSYDSLGKLLPDSVLGVHRAADAPLNGIALLLGVPLLVTLLSPRRWRRYAQPPGLPGARRLPAELPGAAGHDPAAVPAADPSGDVTGARQPGTRRPSGRPGRTHPQARHLTGRLTATPAP
jgi:hypothetical protein